MAESHLAEILLELAVLLAATYLLGGLLSRLRIPVILAALLVAMAAHFTPLGESLLSTGLYPVFEFLGNLGVLFLLFFIGLQIDIGEMRSQSRDIVLATVLNTVVPFLLGVLAMLLLGYGWLVSFVVGLTRMPTAEAVIVPILDEFKMIRTRIGHFIVGAGVLDDVIEVFLVAFVSVWIGEQSVGATGAEKEIEVLLLNLVIFVIVTLVAYRWLWPLAGNWLPRRTRNLVLLGMCVLFGFGGYSEYSGLGLVVGAIVAGILMRPILNNSGEVGLQADKVVSAISYGFFGVMFFFWVGLSVDLEGMLHEPLLAIVLLLVAFAGKLLGIFLMVPMGKLNKHEAWAIGIGLNARLTTEIIVARLLLDAGLIDNHLFTALIAASSVSTIVVPLLFTFIVRRWGRNFELHQPATTGE